MLSVQTVFFLSVFVVLCSMSFAVFQCLTFKHIFLFYSVVLGLTVFECSRPKLKVTTTFICESDS